MSVVKTFKVWMTNKRTSNSRDVIVEASDPNEARRNAEAIYPDFKALAVYSVYKK